MSNLRSYALPYASLKLVACAHLGALSLQPVLVGQYLAGRPEIMAIHGPVGETAVWIALAQAVVALWCWRLGAVHLWTAVACVAIFALDGLQVHLGHARTLTVHIPLGAGLLALSLALTLEVWGQLRRARRERVA